MERTLREKQLRLMAKNVSELKDIIKKWYNHAGIKYLQEHELTDEQEALLEDITEYINEAIDRMENDENFLKATLLPAIKLPKKVLDKGIQLS